MPETTFTFHVDEDLKNAFTRAAEAQDRPGSQLLRDFMRDYVERADHDAWFRAEVEQGLRELEDPTVTLIANETVEAEWEVRKAELLARVTAGRKG